jgi:hypothetical protein
MVEDDPDAVILPEDFVPLGATIPITGRISTSDLSDLSKGGSFEE